MNTNLPSGLISDLQVKLLNVGQAELGQEWNYPDILSPFSRIYLITRGEGFIIPNNTLYHLKPGSLYLIPSFVSCGYHCTGHLEQFYVHFTNQLGDGFNIYDFLRTSNEVKAMPFDVHLFERLMELNRESELKQSDPGLYEKDNWMSPVNYSSESSSLLETTGIIKQLLSRFIVENKVESKDLQQFFTIRKVFQYIHSNLDKEIRIEMLADLANLSYDHFTRVFKKTSGMVPVKYINMKRIEKAQILLLTTRMTQLEICDATGFNNLPYFHRVFQKLTGTTPAKYRKMGGLV